MPDNPQSPSVALATGRWKPDLIFSILAEPSRRALLFSLAHGKPKSATDLESVTHRRLDATLKHLAVLDEAGMLVSSPDPQDRRRTLYTLSPSVPVTKTPEGGIMIDFGFVMVRL